MVPAALVVLTACSTALGKDIVGEAWSARARFHVCRKPSRVASLGTRWTMR
jgi:hypothetical protein